MHVRHENRPYQREAKVGNTLTIRNIKPLSLQRTQMQFKIRPPLCIDTVAAAVSPKPDVPATPESTMNMYFT